MASYISSPVARRSSNEASIAAGASERRQPPRGAGVPRRRPVGRRLERSWRSTTRRTVGSGPVTASLMPRMESGHRGVLLRRRWPQETTFEVTSQVSRRLAISGPAALSPCVTHAREIVRAGEGRAVRFGAGQHLLGRRARLEARRRGTPARTSAGRRGRSRASAGVAVERGDLAAGEVHVGHAGWIGDDVRRLRGPRLGRSRRTSPHPSRRTPRRRGTARTPRRFRARARRGRPPDPG